MAGRSKKPQRTGNRPRNGAKSAAVSEVAPSPAPFEVVSTAPSAPEPPGQEPMSEQLVMRALSTLVDRQRTIALAAGMQYNGTRDIYSALGYPREISLQTYREVYERGGIAKRIVDAYPRATWAGGALLLEDETKGEETPFEKAARELFQEHDLWSRLLRADILAGLGHYSVLLIGAPGKMDQPLGRVPKILYFNQVGEDRAPISKFEGNTSVKNFGLPLIYNLNLGPLNAPFGGLAVQKQVHHTRTIHIAEGCLDDDVMGEPRLRAVFNYLLDLDKNVGGGSEAAWRRMDPGMQVDVNPEVDLDEEEEARLEDEIDEFYHNLRRTIRTRGTKVTPLSSNVFNFGPNAMAIVQFITATTGIPYRIFIGSERGELASTQDRNNWTDRIAERRREFASHIVRRLVDRLIACGALPKPKKYDVTWPNIEALDEFTKSEILKNYAAANRDHATVVGRPLLTTDELRRNVSGLGPLSEQKDDEAKFQMVPVPGRGQASVPGDTTKDGPRDPNAPRSQTPNKPTEGSTAVVDPTDTSSAE